MPTPRRSPNNPIGHAGAAIRSGMAAPSGRRPPLRVPDPLELRRHEVAQRRMPAAQVVEAIQKPEDFRGGLLARGAGGAAQRLAFLGGEQALRSGVVVAAADGSHRLQDAGLRAAPGERQRRVLATAVGMEDHPLHPRAAKAMSSAARTKLAVCRSSMAEPTTRRLNTSSIAAR